jgi:hypothetical protein
MVKAESPKTFSGVPVYNRAILCYQINHIAKNCFVKPPLLLYKNFWFFHFCCILAFETVESSYLFYSQPVFFKSHSIIKSKTNLGHLN